MASQRARHQYWSPPELEMILQPNKRHSRPIWTSMCRRPTFVGAKKKVAKNRLKNVTDGSGVVGELFVSCSKARPDRRPDRLSELEGLRDRCFVVSQKRLPA